MEKYNMLLEVSNLLEIGRKLPLIHLHSRE